MSLPWELFAAASAVVAAGGTVLARARSEASLLLEDNPAEEELPPPRRLRGRRVSPAKMRRLERTAAEARARDERMREIIKGLPEPPPDPKRFTAPKDKAALHALWTEWYSKLTPEQTEALRVAHNRASGQFMRGGVLRKP